MQDTHKPEFIIGIDLGTTQSVLAYAPLSEAESSTNIRFLEVAQLTGPGRLEFLPRLASFRYHPAADEFTAADQQGPWGPDDEDAGSIIGEWARSLSEFKGGRCVHSAKSWLSHSRTDPFQATLPRNPADAATLRISPVDACASYLRHLKKAWDTQFPHSPLHTQQVVVTIPASFGEQARAATLEAADRAGLVVFRMLEEPQAVVYDWLWRHPSSIAEGNDLLSGTLLVCDIGGGTSDFSLIDVSIDATGKPRMRREAVGEHLLLGGDNMDLALGQAIMQRFRSEGHTLRPQDQQQCLQLARQAKEVLLSDDSPDTYTVTLVGRGSALVGKKPKIRLQREAVVELILNGFLPLVSLEDKPLSSQGAIVELGLPYARDVAISRHLAAFLCENCVGPESRSSFPTMLLLNGGFMQSPILRKRLETQLEHWASTHGAPTPRQLVNDLPEYAVAAGACFYGWLLESSQAGDTRRIASGSARSYCLRLGTVNENVGLCVLPAGSTEGEDVEIDPGRHDGKRLALLTGQPATFEVFSSTHLHRLQAGDLIALDESLWEPLMPRVLTLPAASEASEKVEVELIACLTEIGTLDLRCRPISGSPLSQGPEVPVWRIEVNVRQSMDETVDDSQAEPSLDEKQQRQAASLLQQAFDKNRKLSTPCVKRLRIDLEKLLGPRSEWTVTWLRWLSDQLLQWRERRLISVTHERVWLNLSGYCLRPGYGKTGDPARIDALWAIYSSGVKNQDEAQCWSEWWTLWRRVAGGLSHNRQMQLYKDVAPFIPAAALRIRKLQSKAVARSWEDMVRLVGSLERLDPDVRQTLGKHLLQRLQKPREPLASWWALGRIGNRHPVYAGEEGLIPEEIVHGWVTELLAKDWQKQADIAFAAILMTRSEPSQDSESHSVIKSRVREKLNASRCPPSWPQILDEAQQLSDTEAKRMLGESLPAGLSLL